MEKMAEKKTAVRKTAPKAAVTDTVITAPAEAVTELLLEKCDSEDAVKGVVKWGEEVNSLPYYLL